MFVYMLSELGKLLRAIMNVGEYFSQKHCANIAIRVKKGLTSHTETWMTPQKHSGEMFCVPFVAFYVRVRGHNSRPLCFPV